MKCNYKNIWVVSIQIIKVKPKVLLLINLIFLPKLWNKKSNSGIAIKPENETALAITKYSVTKVFWFLSSIWNKIRKKSDTDITETILVSRFLNDLFSIKYPLKNSIGINKTKREVKKVINDQNNPCPFQLIIVFSTIPTDSRNKYTENPSKDDHKEKKYRPIIGKVWFLLMLILFFLKLLSSYCIQTY